MESKEKGGVEEVELMGVEEEEKGLKEKEVEEEEEGDLVYEVMQVKVKEVEEGWLSVPPSCWQQQELATDDPSHQP